MHRDRIKLTSRINTPLSRFSSDVFNLSIVLKYSPLDMREVPFQSKTLFLPFINEVFETSINFA